MPRAYQIPKVVATAGTPLYQSVKAALLRAIASGRFPPGAQLSSTETLAVQMAVSLVTVHRALRDLGSAGVLDRQQGRGTFVVDRKTAPARKLRLSLALQPGASLAEYYHNQMLEGMNRAAHKLGAELVILHFAQQPPQGCQGHLLLNPLAEQVRHYQAHVPPEQPLLVVGARHKTLPWLDVDNCDLIRQAVAHLHRLGHRRIGFVGGNLAISNNRDRREGFERACARYKLSVSPQHVLIADSWRLQDAEQTLLRCMLRGPTRPTALIAGGYYLALDVYQAAARLQLNVPADLSVVGVDDPPSADHIAPPLTTLRQPLAELGYAAVAGILARIQHTGRPSPQQVLRAKLIIRLSAAKLRAVR